MQPREQALEVPEDQLAGLAEGVLTAASGVRRERSLDGMLGGLLGGEALLLIEGSSEALLVDAKGWQTRAVDEPPSEAISRGPREGFVETLQLNTALLRRRIRDRKLVFKAMALGRRTKTTVVIAYLEDLARPDLVSEVTKRVSSIDIDGVLDTGYLAEFITDAPLSPVNTVGSTERPDVVASRLLEGRVAILADGSPFALTVPSLLVESFQSPQDYYMSPVFQSMVRFTRYLAFLLSVLTLPLYVAINTYNQELIPTPLLLTIAASKEGTPFPAVVETAIMLLFFEVLREATLRMPRVLGQVVGVVGALVIGQASVQAGLVGAPMVIATALTAISSFVVPGATELGAVCRVLFLTLAATLGLFGLVMGGFLVLTHIASVTSFGVPVLSPVISDRPSDLKDTAVRVPWWAMLTRPHGLPKSRRMRQNTERR